MSSFGSSALSTVIFIVFVTVCLSLCVITGPERDEAAEFYTGNQALTDRQNGLAIAGVYISTLTVLTTTGIIALTGADGLLLTASETVSITVLTMVFAEPLRQAGQYTVGDALAVRLPQRSVRAGIAMATLAVCLPYLALQLDSAARVMTFLLDLGHNTTATTACITGIGILMVFYAGAGGMRGTGLVQIIKAAILFTTTGVMCALLISRFHGSLPQLLHAAAGGSGLGSGYLHTGNQYGHTFTGMWSLMGLQLTVIVGAAGLPHVTMRLYAAPTPASARTAMRWASVLTAVFCAMAAIIGLGIPALVGNREVLAADPTGVGGILLLTHHLDRNGLLLTALACAIFITALATVAGLTLAAATSAAHDLITHALRHGETTDHNELRAARWATATIGVLAIVIASIAGGWNLQVLSVVALTTAASALTPTLTYGLFWKRFTSAAASWTIYATIVLTLLLTAFSPQISGTPAAVFPHRAFDWFPLAAPGIITIPTGFIIGWVASLHTGRPCPGQPEDYALTPRTRKTWVTGRARPRSRG